MLQIEDIQWHKDLQSELQLSHNLDYHLRGIPNHIVNGMLIQAATSL
jgi:hypothetical protein